MLRRGKEIDSGYDLEWLKRMYVTMMRCITRKARKLHADELGNFVIQNETPVRILSYDYDIGDSDKCRDEEFEEDREGNLEEVYVLILIVDLLGVIELML